MKTSLLTILFFFSVFVCYCQNLVPNASFEDTLACPFQGGQINYAIGWEIVSNSPDYFHQCASNSLNVPNTALGYQQSFNGDAMTGLLAYNVLFSDAREFFEIQLLQPLNIGQEYFGSLRVSLADNIGSDCAISGLGLKFSTSSMNGSVATTNLLNNDSKIFSQNIINDKLNWTEIKGSFIADSAYQFLLVGNYFTNQNTDTLNCISSSYYFIDDICLSIDSLTCYSLTSLTQLNNSDQILVYPNPTVDFISIENVNKGEVVIIYNSLGLEVWSGETTSTMININVENFSHGIYLLRVASKSSQYIKKIAIK